MLRVFSPQTGIVLGSKVMRTGLAVCALSHSTTGRSKHFWAALPYAWVTANLEYGHGHSQKSQAVGVAVETTVAQFSRKFCEVNIAGQQTVNGHFQSAAAAASSVVSVLAACGRASQTFWHVPQKTDGGKFSEEGCGRSHVEPNGHSRSGCDQKWQWWGLHVEI